MPGRLTGGFVFLFKLERGGEKFKLIGIFRAAPALPKIAPAAAGPADIPGDQIIGGGTVNPVPVSI